MVGPRILIVEDHQVFSAALELLLGHRLLEDHDQRTEFRRAATAAEGLDLVHDDGPFDLAIVDPTLPDGDGAEILGEIEACHPRTRVALLGPIRSPSGTPMFEAVEGIGKDTAIVELISHLACLASGGTERRRETVPEE